MSFYSVKVQWLWNILKWGVWKSSFIKCMHPHRCIGFEFHYSLFMAILVAYNCMILFYLFAVARHGIGHTVSVWIEAIDLYRIFEVLQFSSLTKTKLRIASNEIHKKRWMWQTLRALRCIHSVQLKYCLSCKFGFIRSICMYSTCHCTYLYKPYATAICHFQVVLQIYNIKWEYNTHTHSHPSRAMLRFEPFVFLCIFIHFSFSFFSFARFFRIVFVISLV